MIELLGHGNFGEVWKGTLLDGANRDVPEYAPRAVQSPPMGVNSASPARAHARPMRRTN